MNKRKKSNKSTGRDYSYDKEYQKSPEQVENRVARNKARREAIKKHGKAALKDKDIDHVTPLSKGGSKDTSNTRVRSRSANRADKGKK